MRPGHRKSPSVTSLSLPCGDMQIVPGKEKVGQEDSMDIWEGVVLPCA